MRMPNRNRPAVALLLTAFLVMLAVSFAGTSGCASTGTGRLRQRRTSEELYRDALKMMEQKKYAKARQLLSDIGVRDIQETELDPKVKIALADAYYLDGGITNIIEAQARYEQFINFYPSHEQASYAQYQIGVCLFEQSARPFNDQEYTRRALEEFAKVRALDSEGDWTQRAAEMSARCNEKLARHEFDVGRFYLRKKACDAAAGRFRRILNDYPGFSEVDGAYYYLGESLICSNNTEEGKIYLDKLINDFPESRYASQARDTLGSLKG